MEEFWSNPVVRTGLIPLIITFLIVGFQLLAKQNGQTVQLQDFWGLGVSLGVVALVINSTFLFNRVGEAYQARTVLLGETVDQFWGIATILLILLVFMAAYQRFVPARSTGLAINLVLLPTIMVGVGLNGLVLFAWG